jgi:hypothetical protein
MIEKRYVYRGNAVGASAHITRVDTHENLEHYAPALATASLPDIGGVSEGNAEDFNFSVDHPRKLNVLSFKSAKTRAEGKKDGKGGWTTRVDSHVRGLSILEHVFVDSIDAHLRSSHVPDDHHPLIRAEGNRIEGLRLDDYALNVVLDESVFIDCGSKTELAQRFATDRELRTRHAWRFNAEPEAPAIPEHRGYFICSLVREIGWVGKAHPDVTIDGYTLRWRNFGRIHLGEILIGEGVRRLMMVRAEMGSPVEGSAAGGGGDINGSTMP